MGCAQSKTTFKKNIPKNAFLSLNDFCRILEPLVTTTVGVSLSRYGEPMLNKDLISMIEFAHSKNIGVDFPTNFSLKFSDEYLERLVKSGLDKIIISLDGANRETYEQYRVGGNFDIVKSNVQRLSAIKEKLHKKIPTIEWKFIVFEHNKHEIEYAKRNFKRWGFNSLSFVSDIKSKAHRKAKTKQFKKGKSCFWVYNTIIIDWDGNIRPCCSAGGWDIGNALQTNIKLIWNNEKYQALREGFSFKSYEKKMHPICKRVCFKI